ncbi:MAG: DMT family transporter [Pseudomonadota bacterium]
MMFSPVLSKGVVRPAALGPVLGALTVLCWASFNVAAIHGLAVGLHPIDLTLLRFGAAGLVLAPALVWLWRQDGSAARWPSIRQTLTLACLGGPLFGALAVGGYAHAPLSHGMVIAPAAVFAVGTIFAIVLNGEQVRPPQVFGGLVILAGLVTLSGLLSGDAQPGAWRGAVLFAAAGSMWAGFTALMRHWSVDPLRGTIAVGVTSGLVTPIVFIVVLWMGMPSGMSDTPMVEVAGQFVAQGLVGGVISVFALMSAARRLGAATAALLPSFAPAVALALAIPVLGQWPSHVEVVGVFVVTVGLGIATRRERRR